MTEVVHRMEQERLFKIEEAVMRKITKRRLLARRTRAAAAGLLVFGAALCLLPALDYAYSFASTSGFFDYVSIASDWSALAGSWKPLLLSVLDSAPILGIVFLSAALFVCAYAAQVMSRALNSTKVSLA